MFLCKLKNESLERIQGNKNNLASCNSRWGHVIWREEFYPNWDSTNFVKQIITSHVMTLNYKVLSIPLPLYSKQFFNSTSKSQKIISISYVILINTWHSDLFLSLLHVDFILPTTVYVVHFILIHTFYLDSYKDIILWNDKFGIFIMFHSRITHSYVQLKQSLKIFLNILIKSFHEF